MRTGLPRTFKIQTGCGPVGKDQVMRCALVSGLPRKCKGEVLFSLYQRSVNYSPWPDPAHSRFL